MLSPATPPSQLSTKSLVPSTFHVWPLVQSPWSSLKSPSPELSTPFQSVLLDTKFDFVEGSNAVLKSHWWILFWACPVIYIFLPSLLKLIPVPSFSCVWTAKESEAPACVAAVSEFAEAPLETDNVLFSSTVAVLFAADGALIPDIVIVIVAVSFAVSPSLSVKVYVKTSVTVSPVSSVLISSFAA